MSSATSWAMRARSATVSGVSSWASTSCRVVRTFASSSPWVIRESYSLGPRAAEDQRSHRQDHRLPERLDVRAERSQDRRAAHARPEEQPSGRDHDARRRRRVACRDRRLSRRGVSAMTGRSAALLPVLAAVRVSHALGSLPEVAVTLPPEPPPQAPLSEPSLTWFRLHAGSTVIDFPLHAAPGTRTWAATMWPDRRAPGGWARYPWEPSPLSRGFIPAAVELGDVIQFGVE